MKNEEYFYDDDYYENQPLESCPQCGRNYDEIDFDYQICSKCGWDTEREVYDDKIQREPEDNDFMNGDADFLTGHWY